MTNTDMVRKWLEKSGDDLIVAEHVFNDLYPKQIEIACYHCQQSAEKALKAFLQHNETEPPKTHNLIVLYQMCEEICGCFTDIMNHCIELTPYSITTRYPNEIEITEEEAKSAIIKTKEVYDFVRFQIQQRS